MKISIDRTKCDGYAKCVQAAPKVFRLDSKMIAEVIDAKAESDDRILLTAKLCPTKAIILEEETTGNRIFPPD
jgi:ferredoxin